MAIEPIYILYGVIFISVLLLVEGIYYLFIDSTLAKRRANRRVSMLDSGMEGREVLDLLRRQTVNESQGLDRVLHPISYLENLIAQSGAQTTPRHIAMFMGGIAFAVLVGLQVLYSAGRLPPIFSPIYVQAVVAVLVGVLLPVMYLSNRAADRKKKFGEQLPDTLDIMVRSLRAGHPINAALALVSKEMSDPIGTEFGIAVDEMTYGLEMNEALENLNERVQVEDFNYVVMSINIQRETGGNLAGVLSGLAYVIRERARMFLKVRALSSEGRMSAMILCILPIATGAFIFAGNPGFYTEVADDPLFLPILSLAIFDLVAGIYMIRRMINFRV